MTESPIKAVDDDKRRISANEQTVYESKRHSELLRLRIGGTKWIKKLTIVFLVRVMVLPLLWRRVRIIECVTGLTIVFRPECMQYALAVTITSRQELNARSAQRTIAVQPARRA
jgi:hypothetical protein